MCYECRTTPCDSRCPNAPEPAVLHNCETCGADIQDGDEYYRNSVNEQCYCTDCISIEIAEQEEAPEPDYDLIRKERMNGVA